MSPANELSKAYEPTEVESRWYARWMELDLFRAEATSDKPPFCIVLPPPNVTGSLHLGHALTATIQDIIIRWKRMSGFNCLWLPGTDHAGIATQMVVERELKRTTGKGRHDLGREAFLARVWEWKAQYGARITEQHKLLGASLDWSRERFTMDEGVSAAVREVFVRLHEQGLLYRSEKLINWCPSCLTALSDLEVEHEEKDGHLWEIAYPVKGTDQRLVVATTRPETMLGDTAVAVHPDDPRYAGLPGRQVALPLTGRDIPIIADAQLVSMEFGTGVVKVTPAHDPNDYETGLRHSLPMINIFDDRAVVNAQGGAYAGLDRSAARSRVLADLAAQGFLVGEKPHRHAVGTCQRCATVVEPRLSPQWFVRVKPLAERAIEAVEAGRTRFVPESWTSTFYAWMRNIHDWCVSRQLWWGHQIPAWYPKDTSPKLSDGRVDFARATPVVARVKPGPTSDNPSGEWEQDPDVLDTWFSSGLWPFSTLGWPQQTAELKTFYPNAMMETGHDIIFFWVARMMMMGLHFMDDVPFRTVFLHAMVRDEKGEKMSKTKGNVIDPVDIVRGAPAERLLPSMRNKFPQGMPAMGADALRFTLASQTQQGRDIKLSVDRIAGYKAFANKLWNAARFALMNLGDFEETHERSVRDRPLGLADRWVLSRLNAAVRDMNAALEGLHFAEAASIAYQFTWGELCDWYIEMAKVALNGGDDAARTAARATLVACLDVVLRALHPFMPFVTEEIWQKLPMRRAAASVGLAPYPVADPRLDDPEAEAELAPVIEAIEGLRSIRGESNLSPALKLDAEIQSPSADVRRRLEAGRSFVMPLAGLGSLAVKEPGAKPALAAAEIRASMELYVPLAGVLDLNEERERLKKEMAKAQAELGSIRKRIDNPSFVARAPAEVVDKDRARVTELESRLAKLEATFGRLSPAEAPVAPARTAGAVHAAVGDLSAPAAAPQAKGDPEAEEVLAELRQGKRGALSPRDHADLGVAYGSLGLVDEAVSETAKAQQLQAAAPRKQAPKAQAPKKQAPKKQAPKKQAPKAQAPKKQAPKKQAPKKQAPKKQAPKKQAPKAQAAKRGATRLPAAKGRAVPASKRAAPRRRAAKGGRR